MNQTVIIGNAICLVGATIMIMIGFIKSKKHILYAQNLQFLIMGIGNLILGGVTGAVSNAVSIVRNFWCLKWAFTTPVKLVFILAQLVISFFANSNGWVGWLPVIAACVFTWFLDTENEVLLKAVIIFTEVMWLIYDFSILNYVTMAFDGFTIISNIIGIFMVINSRKKQV